MLEVGADSNIRLLTSNRQTPAEQEGFEPPCLSTIRFQGGAVCPLRHCSVSDGYNSRETQKRQIKLDI